MNRHPSVRPGPAPDAARPAPDAAWHALTAHAALEALQATADGLAESEAAARLARHGRNALPAAAGRPAWRRLADQFDNLLIYVLIAAGTVTLWLGHGVDAGVIFGVVLVNALIGYVQEGKAERALDAVRAMLALRANVRRSDAAGPATRREIDAALLVPGDIVELASGDRVPADLRLLRARNLRIDESALTGESLPVDKHADAVSADAALADRHSMAFSGTLVTAGLARGVVVATGRGTELGRIGAMVAGVGTLATPLARKLDQFGRRITGFILAGAAAAFTVARVVHDAPAADTFMAMVGLAVAAIPEGLPAVVTITLAIGTQRMARRQAIVRRLPAVETLGSVTVICSDKTGTLTRNEMTAVEVVLPTRVLAVQGSGYAPAGGFTHDGAPVAPAAAHDLQALARCALLCNDAQLHAADGGWAVAGDPTEGALLTLAGKAGLDAAPLRAAWPRHDEVPFESAHRWMATLHSPAEGGPGIVYLKGAPERVLDLCSHLPDGRPVDRAAWAAAVARGAAAGQRMLALACREAEPGQQVLAPGAVGGGFTLLGLVALMDPPRPEATAAVAVCRAGGVRVLMITGDHADTAAAIARQLGLGDGRALSGHDIDALDDAALARALPGTAVVARASPEHKLRIIATLQAQGQVVAMTGDGVNDAPALKAADIGVAMGGKGTDAAREASDIVLGDDNFATIATAVREGRTIYDNIKKSLLFVLPTNGGQAGVVLLAVLGGLALPITAVQILWVNMVTTVTLAIALAFDPPEDGVMQRPPRHPAEPLVTRALLGRVLFVSVVVTAVVFAVYEFQLASGATAEAARTAAVNTVVLAEMAYLFNTRHTVAHAFTQENWLGNRVALGACAVLALLQLAFTHAPPMQALFGTASVSPAAWAASAAGALVVFLAVEAEKALLRRRGVRQV